MTASPISRMGTSLGRMAGGSVADRNYGRCADFSVRLVTAPQVQVIQNHSSSAPPYISPHRWVLWTRTAYRPRA